MEIFHNDWKALLAPELEKPYYRKLRAFLIEEYKKGPVYPDMYAIFNALHATPYARTKAVLLGQDPYHGAGQAHGLSFSVQQGVAPPPSLVNIFKELHDDIGCPIPAGGCLARWAEQGVLLLNSCLTVRAHAPASHQGKGWEVFTDRILSLLGAREAPCAFVLWGAAARRKKPLIANAHHLVIESAHPSPLSAHRGFFGSRPFSRINAFLQRAGEAPIDWRL